MTTAVVCPKCKKYYPGDCATDGCKDLDNCPCDGCQVVRDWRDNPIDDDYETHED